MDNSLKNRIHKNINLLRVFIIDDYHYMVILFIWIFYLFFKLSWDFTLQILFFKVIPAEFLLFNNKFDKKIHFSAEYSFNLSFFSF